MRFAASQTAAGRDVSDILIGQRAAFRAKIVKLRSLTVDDAATLTNAINAGPWGAAHVGELTNAVAERVMSEKPLGGKSGARAQQNNRFVEHYLTEVEWGVIQSSTVTLTEKVDLVARVCSKLGLFCPSEQTYARLVAMLCVLGVGMKDPPIPTLRDMLYAVKRAVKREDNAHGASYAYGHTADFPMDPKDLNKAMFDHVFGMAAPVRCVEPHVSQIAFVSRIKFLRASSSIARSDAAASSGFAPPAASAVNPHQMMAQFMSAMVAQFTSPSLTLCPPPLALSAGVMQPPAPQHAPPMAALMPPQQPPQPLASIEDASVDALAELRLEMAAAHATAAPLAPRRQTTLKTMKGNARAAAALGTAGSADEGGTYDGGATDGAEEPVAAVRKRPACAATATPSTRKRPAAALLNTRKTVTSRAYDACYRTLIAKGKTIDAAKISARKAYNAAASKPDANA